MMIYFSNFNQGILLIWHRTQYNEDCFEWNNRSSLLMTLLNVSKPLRAATELAYFIRNIPASAWKK